MKLIISASNALAKWMGLELVRIPSPDGKQVGVQPLVSDEMTLAWQCHVMRLHSRAKKGVVIAVEAQSRYTVLMPFNAPPTVEAFENELRRCWGNAFLHFSLESGAIAEEAIPEIIRRFSTLPVEYQWYRNTDLSVNGHVSDAEQWVKQTRDEFGIDHLSENDAMGLEMHINHIPKRMKVNRQRSAPFFSITRLVDDGLFRFAKGMSRFTHPDTPKGDFPSPYRGKMSKSSTSSAAKDNVVHLSDYKKRRGGER